MALWTNDLLDALSRDPKLFRDFDLLESSIVHGQHGRGAHRVFLAFAHRARAALRAAALRSAGVRLAFPRRARAAMTSLRFGIAFSTTPICAPRACLSMAPLTSVLPSRP